MRGGQLLTRFMDPVAAFLNAHVDDSDLADLAPRVRDAAQELEQSIALVMKRAKEQPAEIGAAASELLRQFGLVALGFVWLRIAKAAAQGQTRAENLDFYAGKLNTARFFIQRLLPEARFRAAAVASGCAAVMAMRVEQF
jgi:hypothetical protein